jgi:putative ubiquitin-RnfH superfamily antitoxin RatB of RatAB toxin-antitoxin module
VIVTVVYARPDVRHLLQVEIAPGATIEQAIEASGLLSLEPELRTGALDVGVWNRVVRLDSLVSDGDRIEVYRPLTFDPKEARRIRANVRRRRKQKG